MTLKFKNNFLFRVFLILVALSLASCSKKEIPEPPRVYRQLLLELLSSLEKGDHKTALAKIARLRDIDKTNIFLAKLENSERNNMYITEAQEYLDQNNPDKAMKIIQDAINAHGKHKLLLDTKNEIYQLKVISNLVNSMNNPTSAVKVAKDAVRFKALIKNYPPASVFNPFIQEKIALALEMEKGENSRSVSDLSSDIILMAEGKDPAVTHLISELAVESPNHPLVREYLLSLKDPSVKSKFSYITSETKEE